MMQSSSRVLRPVFTSCALGVGLCIHAQQAPAATRNPAAKASDADACSDSQRPIEVGRGRA